MSYAPTSGRRPRHSEPPKLSDFDISIPYSSRPYARSAAHEADIAELMSASRLSVQGKKTVNTPRKYKSNFATYSKRSTPRPVDILDHDRDYPVDSLENPSYVISADSPSVSAKSRRAQIQAERISMESHPPFEHHLEPRSTLIGHGVSSRWTEQGPAQSSPASLSRNQNQGLRLSRSRSEQKRMNTMYEGEQSAVSYSQNQPISANEVTSSRTKMNEHVQKALEQCQKLRNSSSYLSSDSEEMLFQMQSALEAAEEMNLAIQRLSLYSSRPNPAAVESWRSTVSELVRHSNDQVQSLTNALLLSMKRERHEGMTHHIFTDSRSVLPEVAQDRPLRRSATLGSISSRRCQPRELVFRQGANLALPGSNLTVSPRPRATMTMTSSPSVQADTPPLSRSSWRERSSHSSTFSQPRETAPRRW